MRGLCLWLTAVAAVAATVVWEDAGPLAATRHLYLLPALGAALTHGAHGGAVIGLGAGLAHATMVLPAIEGLGAGAASVDGLLSLVLPLAGGVLVGGLRDRSADRARRLRALGDLHRALAARGEDEPDPTAAIEIVRRVLEADAAALVLRAGPGPPTVATSTVSGGAWAEGSAVAWVLRTGRPVEAGDLGRDPRFAGCRQGPRPWQGLALPIATGGPAQGALAVEWLGGAPGGMREAAGDLAMHLALAIGNARLEVARRRAVADLDARVQAATARLREADRAKSEFVSVVSHELRTPLTALQGFSELLLTRPVPPEQARRFLTHVHTEAERLGRIVGELLDLARIEAGRPPELQREPVDLRALVEQNVELSAVTAPAHTFRWAVEEGLPLVLGDRDALDRVLKNLLSNAVRYSPCGGAIDVRAGRAVDRPGQVELIVEDQGVGIPPEQLPRIFERYVRVPTPGTAGVRGLGLGLAVVRSLVAAHGGTVDASSRVGHGSRFTVCLPG